MAAAAASAAQQPSASAAAAPTLAAQQPSISAAAAPWALARGVKDNHASQKMLEHYGGAGAPCAESRTWYKRGGEPVAATMPAAPLLRVLCSSLLL